MKNQEEKSTPKARGNFWQTLKKRFVRIVMIALVAIIAVLSVYIWFFLKDRTATTVTISTLLQEALDIDELSASSFTYNGIADVYDPATQKVSYSTLYHATVKVGIAVGDIAIDVDEERKAVHIQLPEIKIQNVIIDPSYIDFIPDRAEIHMATALATCRSDALREATESEQLMDAARENLQSVVEALTQPIIEDAGYTLEW